MKLVVAERGSEVADRLWDRAELVVSSRLCYPDARAAVAAARRGHRLGSRAARSAVSGLDHRCEEMTLLGVDGALAHLAGELAEHHALRGYDAVHLATALSVSDPELVVATWDTELARAALTAGRIVAPAAR